MKRCLSRTATLAVLACLSVRTSFAVAWYVTPDGAGEGSSWESPTNSLQGAIDAIPAGAGNTVWVGDGVYDTGTINYPAGSVMTNRIAVTKAITVRSLNGPAVTTIKGTWHPITTNGPSAVRCVYLAAGAQLIGFTITNGATPLVVSPPDSVDPNEKKGGGVWCFNNTSTIISNCIISGNAAHRSGGGVFQGVLYDCVLAGNECSNMGGGGARDSTLYNCLLIGNRAINGGATRNCTLDNCLVTGNRANNVGACWYGSLYNCTVVDNAALIAGNCGGVSSAFYLHNCIVYHNTAPGGVVANWAIMTTAGRWINICTTPTNTATGVWTAGNTVAEPRFVNREAGNYRLRTSSPCVNGGANAALLARPAFARSKDLDGNPRILPKNGVVDIGAYETYLWRGSQFVVR